MEKTSTFFSPAMKAAVSARLDDPGRLRTARRSPFASASFTTRRLRPVDLGDRLMAEVVHELVQGRLHGRQGRELLDERIARGQRLLGEHRVPVPVEHRPAHQVPALIGEGRHALHGKAWAR